MYMKGIKRILAIALAMLLLALPALADEGSFAAHP